MKTAVLISGEYRTFKICRQTMRFLNDPNVDVYLSTWKESHIKNETLGINMHTYVTSTSVLHDLAPKIPTALDIQELVEKDVWKKYSSKMVYRWVRGIKLIKHSGVSYDQILIIRPDLYFPEEGQELFPTDSGTVYCAWATELEKELVGDMVLYGRSSIIFDIVTENLVEEWNNSVLDNIHEWLFKYITARFKIKSLHGSWLHNFSFCRFPPPVNNYEAVTAGSIQWDHCK